jgi:hypothetical protein
MKNIAILKKFTAYCGFSGLALLATAGIMYSAEKLFGQSGYGLLAILVVFVISFLWMTAKSNVEIEQREAQWAKEREALRSKV